MFATLPKIVHLAFRVPDARQAAAFYKTAFGFRELVELHVKNLTAIHMKDERTYLSIVQYHSDATAESRVAPGPCIHHYGLEAEDPAALYREIEGMGCKLVSPPGEIPIKFLAPDGILGEIAPLDWFRRKLELGENP